MAIAGQDGAVNDGDGSQWQDAIRLLRLVKGDYQGFREQLQTVSHTLAERGALVSQRLQNAIRTSEGFQTLCLVPRTARSTGSQMGRAILGESAAHNVLSSLMRLEVHCLGRFEVSSGWRRIERWQSAKAKSVLQYLMSRPREPISKDMLMEAIWAECDPHSASNNLKVAMYGLRQTIGRLLGDKEGFPHVLFLQGSYLTNPEIDLWVDVEEF